MNSNEGYKFGTMDVFVARENFFKKSGSFGIYQRRSILRDVILPSNERTLSLRRADNQGTNSDLAGISRLLKETGRISSPISVTFQYIRSYADLIVSQAMNGLQMGSRTPKYWIPFFDLAAGIAKSWLTFEDAQKSISGTVFSDYLRDIEQAHEAIGEHALPTPLVETSYLISDDALRNAELLKKDPTGALIIENLIKELEGGSEKPALPNFLEREFVIEGVKFSRALHRITYPLAVALNSKK